MSYYDTIEEDIARAKEILARGCDPARADNVPRTIIGADIYAAVKLLESFVAELESRSMTQAEVEEIAAHIDKLTKKD